MLQRPKGAKSTKGIEGAKCAKGVKGAKEQRV